jgi:hypothetical protein
MKKVISANVAFLAFVLVALPSLALPGSQDRDANQMR